MCHVHPSNHALLALLLYLPVCSSPATDVLLPPISSYIYATHSQPLNREQSQIIPQRGWNSVTYNHHQHYYCYYQISR